jgi:hypothetical protein
MQRQRAGHQVELRVTVREGERVSPLDPDRLQPASIDQSAGFVQYRSGYVGRDDRHWTLLPRRVTGDDDRDIG